VLYLLKMSDSELKDWVTAQEPHSLRQTFQSMDSEIRGAQLTAGQPRSLSSTKCVELAHTALRIAEQASDEYLLIEAWRMLAYSLNADEQHEQSLQFYALAIPGLERLGNFALAARTRLGYISALGRASQYEEALRVAEVAEHWFVQNQDEVNLAKLCHNVATLYNRLYQPADAYRYFMRAQKTLERLGDPKAIAQWCLKVGNTLSNMDRFDDSDAMYAKSETLSLENGLTELWAQASYNRAFLKYQRGRYAEAIQGFQRFRKHFERTGSDLHYALCDMDESEIHLQLNLSAEAEALARRAIERFTALNQNFEIARSRAFLGVALMHQGRFTDALEAFEKSHRQFEDEGNIYWTGVLELYRAEVHNTLRRFWEARSLAHKARARFAQLRIPSKRILALVLLGRISLELKDLATADKAAREAAEIVDQAKIPLLLFPYYLLRGDIAEQQEFWNDAERFYENAAEDLELHQASLHHDDLRVTFFKGRNRAYEELVALKLRSPDQHALADAYAWCERSKSRGLIELLAQHLPAVQVETDEPLLGKLNRLREELNALYVRSQPDQLAIRSSNLEIISSKETELARTLREVSLMNPEYVSLQQVTTATMDSVQSLLPDDTTLVEYFIARDEILAFVVTRHDASVQRHLSPASRITDLQRRLSFQLEKFQLGPQYVENHSEQILMATNRHLEELYRYLVNPIRDRLNTPKLIVVPHGTLHLLPFHAFYNPPAYLLDDFEIVYAPSVSVLKYCLEKQDVELLRPLLVGVADERAPLVEAEVDAIRHIVPHAEVLLNQSATREAFTAAAMGASFMHIAAHAVFRRDNPMFSGFKLSDGWVTAFDVFSMNCPTNLVTLSGCSSGVAQITGSDDLLGLTRGFLDAGARSLMVSLWNVDDKSTSELMARFYDFWQQGSARSTALREAMKAVREGRPNPFYWAPFLLIGKP